MTASSPNFFAGVPQNNSSEKPQYEYYYEYIYDDSDENYKGPPLENYNTNSSKETLNFASSQEKMSLVTIPSKQSIIQTKLEITLCRQRCVYSQKVCTLSRFMS